MPHRIESITVPAFHIWKSDSVVNIDSLPSSLLGKYVQRSDQNFFKIPTIMCRGFQSGRHRSDGFCENGLTWARLKAAPCNSTLSHPTLRWWGVCDTSSPCPSAHVLNALSKSRARPPFAPSVVIRISFARPAESKRFTVHAEAIIGGAAFARGEDITSLKRNGIPEFL